MSFLFRKDSRRSYQVRYCASSLLSPRSIAEARPTQPAVGPDQTIYILDNGLLRFGKFAAGVLAIFIAVGATFYGFSIKEASDKARDSSDKARDLADKVYDLTNTVRTQKEAVDNQAKSISITEAQIRKAKDDVDQQVKILLDTVQRINDTAREVASDHQRVKELLQQTERDSLRAHSMVAAQDNPQHIAAGESGSADADSRMTGSLSVPQIARLYNFPSEFDGKGQTIGFIELGGGYLDSDLVSYFKELNLMKPT
jgi:hypothetical protein